MLRMLGARPVYVFGAAGTVGVRRRRVSARGQSQRTPRSLSGERSWGPAARRWPIASWWRPRTNGRCRTAGPPAAASAPRRRRGRAPTSYVSSVTGEVVMQTTRQSRGLAYLGPVPHWLYLPVLRRNGPLWSQVVVACRRWGAWRACRDWRWACGGCQPAAATGAMAGRPSRRTPTGCAGITTRAWPSASSPSPGRSAGCCRWTRFHNCPPAARRRRNG